MRDFLKAIGDQADAPLETLSTDTFLAFKEWWLSGGRAPRRVNQTIKIYGSSLEPFGLISSCGGNLGYYFAELLGNQ